MRDAEGSRRKRAKPIAHEQISVVIDGRSIVEAYTKRRLLHDLAIRHRQVLLALAFLCWITMLGCMASWIGKAPMPGRETDRVVLQTYSFGAAVLLWIFVAALLLVGSSKLERLRGLPSLSLA